MIDYIGKDRAERKGDATWRDSNSRSHDHKAIQPQI